MKKINPFKIKVNNNEELTIIQKTLFSFGYKWDMFRPESDKVYDGFKFIIFRNLELEWTNDENVFNSKMFHSRNSTKDEIFIPIEVPEITFYNFIENFIETNDIDNILNSENCLKWLRQNKDSLTIRGIEKQLNMPDSTLIKAVSKVQALPKKWEQPLIDFIVELQKPIG